MSSTNATGTKNNKTLMSYADIQTRVDNLYKTAWFQPNAIYPLTFLYTSKDVDADTNHPHSLFFRRFYNTKLAGNLATAAGSAFAEPTGGAFKTINDLVAEEKQLKGENLENCLNYFSTIEGLSPFSVPLDKTNGAINAAKDVRLGGNGSCTLKFLCDREFKTLHELQKWQSKWVSFSPDIRSLASHTVSGKKGGEGYLSLLNCDIKTDGTIQVLSHFAVFGLIPKTVNLKSVSTIGPRSSTNNLPEIEVTCLYSSAVLSYPTKDDTGEDCLGYYFFK